jgi:hypothetical protein
MWHVLCTAPESYIVFILFYCFILLSFFLCLTQVPSFQLPSMSYDTDNKGKDEVKGWQHWKQVSSECGMVNIANVSHFVSIPLAT